MRVDRIDSATKLAGLAAEWEPQVAIWLSWPHKLASWPGQFRPVPYAFAKIVTAISRRGR